MNRTVSLNTHYHIRWSSTPIFDWQAFDSLKEAETVAKQLVRGGETYSVEAVTGDCKRCLQALEESLKRNAVYKVTRMKIRSA